MTLEIDMDLTNALITKLRDGDLDLGLIPGPVIEANLVSQSVGQVQFVWMASPCLDISKKILTPHDLQDWPIISLSKDSHHYHTIAQWFSNHNAQYKWIISCNNMSVVADLTMAGVGVSHLPPPCYREKIKSRKLRVLKTDPLMPAVEFFVLSARGRFQPVANAISSLAQEVSDFVRPRL